jgi:hypothetical protein
MTPSVVALADEVMAQLLSVVSVVRSPATESSAIISAPRRALPQVMFRDTDHAGS